MFLLCFFFFQAEDGIRDRLVTGVQTCALPIWGSEVDKFAPGLRIQILRTKDDLDIDNLKRDVDLLVLNYAQLRVGEEILTKQEWLAVILDEGQQIKKDRKSVV